MIAGTANLLNLLDLRPGRAIKAGCCSARRWPVARTAGIAAGAVGAAAGLLPDDLGEEIMLGDGGANALGALLGVRARRPAPARSAGPGCSPCSPALTAASEKVSFTRSSSGPRCCANSTRWAGGRLT